jgi:hypothetical protein
MSFLITFIILDIIVLLILMNSLKKLKKASALCLAEKSILTTIIIIIRSHEFKEIVHKHISSKSTYEEMDSLIEYLTDKIYFQVLELPNVKEAIRLEPNCSVWFKEEIRDHMKQVVYNILGK